MKTLQKIAVGCAALLMAGCNKGGGVTSNPGDSGSDSKVISTYKDVAKYEGYLTETSGSESDMDFSYVQDDTDSTLFSIYLDNISEDHFFIATVEIFNSADSKDPLDTFSFKLIRPGSWGYGDINSDTEDFYYNVKDVTYYTLDYPSTIDYNFIEDGSQDNNYIDVLIDGSYTPEDVESIAKREYAIGVLTDYMEDDIYFFDSTMTADAEYPDYPDITSAVYFAKMDFDAKTITIYEGNSDAGTAISTVTMD